METDFEMSVRQFLARPPFGYRGLSSDDLALFCAALTHDSFVNERGGDSYERLEFLGDAVLELIACESVYRDTDLAEGAMTDYKQDKVSNRMVSERVSLFVPGFDAMMRVGGGHRGPDGNIIEDNMRADAFEAVMAAVYLTKGLDEARRLASETVLRDLPGEGPE